MNTRGLYLRRRGNPWRWPVAVLVTCSLFLGGLFFTPDAWIDWFMNPRDSVRLADGRAVRPWLVLVPPPVIEVIRAPTVEPVDRRPPGEPAPEMADWWRRGWRIRVAETASRDLRPSAEDSTRYLLTSLGLAPDLARRARPDSILAARLILLRRQESYRFDELKPYFEAMTRARAYADLHSRVADMYDNFLAQEIMVPD